MLRNVKCLGAQCLSLHLNLQHPGCSSCIQYLCNLRMLKCTLHHSSCNYTAGYCSFQYNCSLWIGVAHQEPLVLAMESARSHQLPPSTYSHWDSKTYSAEAASPWFGYRHGESVVQLRPLSALLVLFILWPCCWTRTMVLESAHTLNLSRVPFPVERILLVSWTALGV